MFFRASFTTEINTLSATHSMTKPEVKWRRRWSYTAFLALKSLKNAVLFGLWCFCQKQVVSIERYFSRSTMQWRQPWQLGGRSRSREVAVPRISREKVPKVGIPKADRWNRMQVTNPESKRHIFLAQALRQVRAQRWRKRRGCSWWAAWRGLRMRTSLTPVMRRMRGRRPRLLLSNEACYWIAKR